MNAIFGVTGWKNSGKTTLTARLVTVLKGRGYSVSTLKHAHKSFDLDREGTDSFAHREAGAGEVALVSSKRWAIMHETETPDEQVGLQAMLDRMSPCDLVIIEGFKQEQFPKVECIRGESQKDDPIWKNNNSVVALARDETARNKLQLSGSDPLEFDLDDVGSIADFIVNHCGLEAR